jgi:hypothetical protein
MPTHFPFSRKVNINTKLGERISVADFGAVGDGVTPCAAAFQEAVTSSQAVDGCLIFIPRGTYLLETNVVIPVGTNNIVFEGEAEATILLRDIHGSIMPGQGLFDVSGQNIQFRHFLVDGQVTTTTPVTYDSIGRDPVNGTLTANTSFWLHGCTKITFYDVTIQHTGGYSIFVDSTLANSENIRIMDCQFLNNRPFLFGLTTGDMNYGSWGGGVFIRGDGSSFSASNVQVARCQFKRNTGNCLWSHAPALTKPHFNFRFTDNYFENTGLDAILCQGLVGGVVSGNVMHRIGYIALDDTSDPLPSYLSNAGAVGIDTGGLIQNVTYKGNSITNANGGAINLDGFSRGTVSDNVCVNSLPGEALYIQDHIADWGPKVSGGPAVTGNISQGIISSNTNNDPIAGSEILIANNTIINHMGGSIGVFAGRNCIVRDNAVTHSALSPIVPIQIGNIPPPSPPVIGWNVIYATTNNTLVTGNRISYLPAFTAPCVFEDPNGTPFTGAVKNWVFGNIVIPTQNTAFEFQKDPNSNSTTQAVNFATAFPVTFGSMDFVGSGHFIQREGRLLDSTSVLRIYSAEGVSQPAIHAQLQGFSSAATGRIATPLFNIGVNGASGTGNITTGDRTSTGFDDSISSGKLLGDSFLGFLGYDALSGVRWDNAAADLLPNTWGLMRFNATIGRWEQSVATMSGARVWTPFAGGGGVAGPSGSVQYNGGGSLAGDAALSWIHSTGQLVVITTMGVAGLAVGGGYIQSDEGLLATALLANNFNTIQAPGGGVFAGSFTVALTAGTGVAAVGGYIHFGDVAATTPTALPGDTLGGADAHMYFSSAGSQVFYMKSSQGVFCFDGQAGNTATGFKLGSNLTGNRTVNIDFHTDATYTDYGLRLLRGNSANADALLANAGTGVLRLWAGLGSIVLSTGTLSSSPIDQVTVDASGNLNVGSFMSVTNASGRVTSSEAFVANGAIGSGSGFSVVTNTAFDSIQTVGGMKTLQLLMEQKAAPGLSTVGNGVIYFDTTAQAFQVSQGGGSYVPLLGGSASTVAGTNQMIQYNNSGAFGASANLLFDQSLQKLTVTGLIGTAGLGITAGFLQSDGGFVVSASNTAFDSIQTLGGVRQTQMTMDAMTVPGLSAANQGVIVFDTSTHQFVVSQNGGAYSPLITSATVAGSSTQVQYNNAGAFGASANFTFNASSNLLTVTSTVATAGILSSGGYVQSDGGFLVTSANTAFNAIQTQGGVLANKCFIDNGATVSLPQMVCAPDGVTDRNGYGAFNIIREGTGHIGSHLAFVRSGVRVVGLGFTQSSSLFGFGAGTTGAFSASYLVIDPATGWMGIGGTPTGNLEVFGSPDVELFTTIPGGPKGRFGASFLGAFSGTASVHPYFLIVQNNIAAKFDTSGLLTVTGLASNPAITAVAGYISSSEGFHTASSLSNCIQAPNGGISGAFLVATQQVIIVGLSTAPSGPGSGQFAFYADASGHGFWWNVAGGNWIQFTSGVSGVSSLSAGTGITLSASTGAITITNSGVSSAVAGTGVAVSSSTGAVSFSIGQAVGVANSVTFAQVSSTGDILASGSFNGLRYLISGTQVISSGGAGSFNGITVNGGVVANAQGDFASYNLSGALLIDTSKIGHFVGVNTGSSGVNINGNVIIDGSGNITANHAVTANGGSGSGFNVTSNTASNSIQTVGGMNATQGYNVGSTQVISNGGVFIGNGVNVGSNGIQAGGYNVFGGFTGQSQTLSINAINGLVRFWNGSAFVDSSFMGLVFVGGVLVGYHT